MTERPACAVGGDKPAATGDQFLNVVIKEEHFSLSHFRGSDILLVRATIDGPHLLTRVYLMAHQPEDDEGYSDDEGFSDEEGSLEEWELWHAAHDQAGRKYYYHAVSGKHMG